MNSLVICGWQNPHRRLVPCRKKCRGLVVARTTYDTKPSHKSEGPIQLGITQKFPDTRGIGR
jgi:hypothetical protein